jgi:cell division septal protein FtsQ
MCKKATKFIWDEIEEPKKSTKNNVRLVDEFEKGFTTSKPTKPKIKKVHVDKKVKKNKFKARVTKLLTVLLFLLIVFAPIFLLNTLNLLETNFTSKEQFSETSQIIEGEAISMYDLLRVNLFYHTESISGAKVGYEFKTKTLTVNLTEITPLAINESNELYYVYDGDIEKSTTLNYQAPILQGFNPEKEEALIKAMQDLEYNVIKEIASIQLVPSEISDELVLMQMKDGNYVKIMISQIPLKMPYYNQMSQTIDAVKGGQDGIIHLDRGDYYEPI